MFGYSFTKERHTPASEMEFVFIKLKAFSSSDLEYSMHCRIMVCIVFVMSYNRNVICNTKLSNNSLNISSIFPWNMVGAEANPNGSLAYLYPPKCHVKLLDIINFHLIQGYYNPCLHL